MINAMNGKKMHRAAILLLLGCLTQAAGCAFGTRYVDLGYPPQKPAKIDAMDPSAALAGPRTRDVILAVNDARPSRDRIGNVRNGYGMDTASILTETNIEVWVYDAIELELEKLGFRTVAQGDAAADRVDDRLTANVVKVYCDIYAIYDGEVTLQAALVRDGENPVTREYPAKVSSGLSFAATGSATGESLAQALQASVIRMLKDLGFDDSRPPAVSAAGDGPGRGPNAD